MRRILVLTSIYPGDDVPGNFTPVVHYFTQEWVRMGYEVRVINYVTNFPGFFYFFSRFTSSFLASKFGFPIRSHELKEREYDLDGVPVFRISMKKLLPHRPHSDSHLKNAEKRTIDYLAEKGFAPDVIVSHWYNPQVDIMSRLKDYYKVPACYVCHSANPAGYYDEESVKRQLGRCDLIGYRSEHIKECVESKYGIETPSFMCYSGIPKSFIKDYPQRSFGDVRRFIFVGNLIKRKYPSQIIEPLAKSFDDSFFEMRYVGTGDEQAKIKEKATEYKVLDRIHFLGRLPREEVIRQMESSDVFVMISKGETYGLVYLEAMARGCITIASRNEGFDGIIKDGVNGFLCNAGDADDLLRIINHVRSMSPEERQVISRNAYDTAVSMTDDKMAEAYLSHLDEIVDKSFSQRQ